MTDDDTFEELLQHIESLRKAIASAPGKDIPIARSPLPAATGRSNVIDVVALVGSATLTVGCGRRVANVPYSGTLRKEGT